MPANLNALIRYKTINGCLYGGRRKWSIEELIDACSSALADSRGRYEAISERTLRDDLRVMRSDILGFNAPIEQEKGLYFYSDPVYSIMSISISDSDLVIQIINLLHDVQAEVNHPDLDAILYKLMRMTRNRNFHEGLKQKIERFEAPASYIDIATEMKESSVPADFVKKSKMASSEKPSMVTWSDLFHVL